MAEWERQAGEPAHWFRRFENYRLAGPHRSVHATWRAEAGKGRQGSEPPGSWRKAVERYQWKRRAAAWDLHVAAEAAVAEADERRVAKEYRRAILKTATNKISQALQHMDPAKMSAFATILGMRVVAKELRAEFDDEPTQRHQLGGLGGGPVEITLELTPPRDYLGDAPGVVPVLDVTGLPVDDVDDDWPEGPLEDT